MAGDADRVQLAYKEEVTYGTNPAGADWKIMRFRGESMGQTADYRQSDEIDSGAQVTGVFRSSAQGGGSVEGRFSWATWDDWIEAVMRSTWVAAAQLVTAETDISVTAATGTYASTTTDFVAEGILPGMQLTIAGFTESGNNGRKRVATVATNAITVYNKTGMVDEIAGDSINMDAHKYIRNGTTERSFSMEKYFGDFAAFEYAIMTGVVIDQWTTRIATEDLMESNWTLAAQDEITSDSAAGSSYDSSTPTTGGLLNSIDNINAVYEGDYETEIDPTQLSWTCANTLRPRRVFKQVGPKSYGRGKNRWTGNVQLFYESYTLVNKFLNDTWTNLSVELIDASSNLVILDLPYIKYTTGPRHAEQEESDVMTDLQWMAAKHATEGFTAQVTLI
jgi:hypothetical protein